MRYLACLIEALLVCLLLIPAANAQVTLQDAIYLYGQDFLAGGAKRIIGKDCDVFELVLDVDHGYTDFKMTQYNVGEGLNYSTYPDSIQSSADMFAYALYNSKDYKMFKFDGNGSWAEKVGSGTVFGYCLSSNPSAKVYLVEFDKCLITYSDKSTAVITPSVCELAESPVEPLPSDPENIPAQSINSINASAALQNFFKTKNWSSLKSNDSYLTTANLMIRDDESYPFITKTYNHNTAFTKVIQFQIIGLDGKMRSQYLWKLHLDNDLKPVGLAFGSSLYEYTHCLTRKISNDLPTSTDSHGIYFSGNQTTNYNEGFGVGGYAHYCDATTANTEQNVEWSVAEGSPNPYFCITTPASFISPKTRICMSADKSGVLTDSLWIRTFRSDGTPSVDYKNTTSNVPIEDLSGTINPNNYWYGLVWRPSDGTVYQRYQNTKFPTELACRNQTQIDWRSTYSAVNLTWSCANVISN